MTSVNRELDIVDFVKRAAEYFEANPEGATFGDIEPDSLLAIRWGLGNDCVLVVRLHEYEQSVVYQQAIKKEKLGETSHDLR
jgi:hypothetical protein